MKRVIGITGGIASGKSSVSNYIKSLGYKVLDADLITHNLYQKGEKGYNAILYLFGEDMVNDISVDRDVLREFVFNNDEKLELLNKTMHPIIYEEIKRLIAESKEDIIFLDIPLLFEAGFETLCDSVILVFVERDIQVERLMKRDNILRFEAIKKISKQQSLEEKRSKADFIVDNSGSIDSTLKQIDHLLERILNE